MSNADAGDKDAAFKAWLAELVTVFAQKHAMSEDDAQEYVWENYTEWRAFFDDGYTPSDAAYEDALAGADR